MKKKLRLIIIYVDGVLKAPLKMKSVVILGYQQFGNLKMNLQILLKMENY